MTQYENEVKKRDVMCCMNAGNQGCGRKWSRMRIITDTGTDILDKEAKKLGIELVAIRSNFTDTVFSENTEAEFTRFYDKLRQTDTLPVSSQPSPAEFLELFEDAKEKQELWNTIQDKALEECWEYPLTYTNFVMVSQKNVTGLDGSSVVPEFIDYLSIHVD